MQLHLNPRISAAEKERRNLSDLKVVLTEMKKNLVLIHGALGAVQQFEEISKLLAVEFNVHVYEIPGHGNRSQEDVEFAIEHFAEDFEKFLKQFNNPITVFGYSMGGYVSIYLAGKNPALFEKIITLGTKFHWNEEEALKENSKLNVELMEKKVPQYCEYLKSLHGAEWKNVVEKTKKLMTNLGKNPVLDTDYCVEIETETVLMLGELDRMVTIDETELMSVELRNASFYVAGGFVHPLEKINVAELADYITRFVNGTLTGKRFF